MLARFGRIPTEPGWRFEPKLDGFRCLTCTHRVRVWIRSRRGWNMTNLRPGLVSARPPNAQLDGEVIASNEDGTPDCHRLCRRMLHGDSSIPVTHMAFDVLALDGEPTTR